MDQSQMNALRELAEADHRRVIEQLRNEPEKCPPEWDLFSTATEQATPEIASLVEQHAAKCPMCSGSLASLLRIINRTSRPVEARPRPPVGQEIRFPVSKVRACGSLKKLQEAECVFPDGSGLHGRMTLENAKHWLTLTDENHPVGTLICVALKAETKAWRRFAVLHGDAPQVRVCVEEAFADQTQRTLEAIYGAPLKFTPDHVALLERSFEMAKSEDEGSLPAWQAWAREKLAATKDLSEKARGVLEQIGPPISPSTDPEPKHREGVYAQMALSGEAAEGAKDNPMAQWVIEMAGASAELDWYPDDRLRLSLNGWLVPATGPRTAAEWRDNKGKSLGGGTADEDGRLALRGRKPQPGDQLLFEVPADTTTGEPAWKAILTLTLGKPKSE